MSLRAGLLANSALALPVVQFLHQADRLAALAVPDLEHDATLRMRQLAAEWQLPCAVVPEARVGTDLVAWIRDARLDVVFVVTFPYRVPEEALDAPRLGVFNLHASDLPRFRGPDPLFWQLREGVSTSMLTAHRMTVGLDDGPIAVQIPLELTPEDTHGVAHFRTGFAAAALVERLVEALEQHGDALPLRDQDESQATRFSRPDVDDLVVDWSRSPAAVCGLVRACNPSHGGAVSFVRGVPLRIYEATPVDAAPGRPPGEILSTVPELVVACEGGAVRLDVLYTDDGVFSGPRFARLFAIQPGEELGAPTG